MLGKSVLRRVLLLAVLVLSWRTTCPAETIAVVLSRSLDPYKAVWNGFSQFAGADLRRYDLDGNVTAGQTLMESLSNGEVACIVTIGSEATQAARGHVKGVPVVYTMVFTPPDFGAEPATGVIGKIPINGQLEALHTLLPNVKRLGVLYDPINTAEDIKQARAYLLAKGLVFVPVPVSSAQEAADALTKLTHTQVDLLWSVMDLSLSRPETIQAEIDHAAAEGIPFAGYNVSQVDAGALLALTVDYTEIGRLTQEVVKGLPASLHDQPKYPTRLVVYVNWKTQEKLKLPDWPVSPHYRLLKR